MNPRDREQLARWIASRASLNDVESVSAIGLVGNERFSERARRAYVLVWTWSAPRFAGSAGAAQDRHYSRHGMPGLARRDARVRKLVHRLTGLVL